MGRQIVFSVTNDLNYDQRMMRICNSLQNAGYQVKLIGRQREKSEALIPRSFEQNRLKCIFNQGKLFYIEYNWRLFFFLLFSKSYDAYSAMDLDTIGPMAMVAWIKRKPLFFDAHEYFWETPEVSRRPIIRSIWKAWGRFWVPKAKIAYTVAPQLAKEFEKIHDKPFSTIRNLPKKSSKEHEPATDNEFIILYQGMLNEGRGLEEFIQAMPAIPNATLWLVGDGDIAQGLRKMVGELSIEPRVKFFGMRPPSELPAITAKAHLGLNLLVDRSKSYYFSLANKCFDYMAAGIPALHMNFPEYKAIDQEFNCFLLAQSLDIDELSQAVLGLMNDRNRYDELCQHNKLAAVELNWEREEIKLIELYQSILGKG